MRIDRKIVSIILVCVLGFGIFASPMTAQAASYPHITDMIDGEGNDIPYFKQVNTGDCGISSIAMIEAYALGYNKTWYQAFYEGVFQANIESGKSPSFSISKVLSGYKSIKKTNDSDTLENIYNQLKKGNPVLIYRTGGKGDHWSVVVAYQGSTSTLEKSGFVVYNTGHFNDSNVHTMNLAEWLSGATWKHAYVRDEGAMSSITKNVKTITLENIYYPKNLKTGNSFSSTGLLISGSNLTKVEVGVKTKGGTVSLTTTVSPSNATYDDVTWKSSNTSVAKVNSSGKVTAVGNGTATITATTVSGKKTATCKVTVSIAATGVTLNKTSATLAKKGDTVSLVATVTPSNAANKKVTWKSNNTSVATVDTNGKVTAVGPGTATITATAADGSGVKATCTITVKEEYKDGLNLYTDGKLYYFKNNKIDTSYNGVADYKGDTWYVKNGKVDTSVNGLQYVSNIWYLFKDGKVNHTTTLVYYNSIWWYVENGQINFSYDGIADYNNATWYIENGQVDFSKDGLHQRGEWYYFENGAVDTGFTGLTNSPYGWWYVENGKITFQYTDLVYYGGSWWYVQNSNITFKYDGVVGFNDATWYLEDSKVDFNKSGLQLRAGTWYLFKGGFVNRIDSVEYYGGSLWYVEDGIVDFGYTGTYMFEGKTYKVVNGQATLVK